MRTQRPRNVTMSPPCIPARERDYQLARLALCGNDEAWNILYERSIRMVPNAVRKADSRHFFQRLGVPGHHRRGFGQVLRAFGTLSGAQPIPMVGAGICKKYPAQPHTASAHTPQEPISAGACGKSPRLLSGPAPSPASGGTGPVSMGGLLSTDASGSSYRLSAGLFPDRLRHLGQTRAADQKSGPLALPGRPQRHPLELPAPLPDQAPSDWAFLFRPKAAPVRNNSRISASI